MASSPDRRDAGSRFASPSTWLAVAGALFGVACADPPPDTRGVEDTADGALEGEIARFISDNEDGTSQIQYFLRRADGSERPLVFSSDPRLAPYTRVALSGRDQGGALEVTSFELLPPRPSAAVAPRLSRLIGAPADPPRKFAFVLIDTGAGVNLTVDTARQRMFDPNFFMVGQGSIRRYYQEDSFGVQDISGDVFQLPYTPANTCDTRGVATALRPMVDTLAGGAPNHYLWYFGSRQAGCQFAGLAQEGSPDRPQRDTWYNASSGCVVLVQEPGHNFGMQHSSSMACPGAAFADTPDGTCTHNEYGDPFDPMGGGCRHMNAWQKAFEGWLQGCNGARVTASGTFTLFPIESPCNGIQVLQVPMPHTRTFTHSGGGGAANQADTLTSYFVELRAPVGFDTGMTASVLVHVAPDLRAGNRSGFHTWLLDMTPNTTSVRDAALPVGQAFNDPAGGVTITAMAISATQATIQVTIASGTGAPTCLDGMPLPSPPPTDCSGVAGGTGAGGTPGGAGGGAGSGAIGGTGGSGAGGRASTADAGSPPAGSGGAGGAVAGSPGETSDADVVGGCGCELRSGTGRGGLAAVGATLLAVVVRRRRRAR